MKIHEYQARDIFRKAGIKFNDGYVAETLDEALQIANLVGFPVVLKSQVLVGGRGRAGGIKLVKDPLDLKAAFETLKKLVIKGYRVKKILVVHAIDIKKEFYVGITIDAIQDDVVLMASSAGGVDIEETAKTNPEAIKKFYFHGERTIEQARWKDFIVSVFSDASEQAQAAEILQKVVKVFYENDCLLAEINPLTVDEKGRMLAADAKINFDDNALMRHDNFESMRDLEYEDPDELEARKNNLSFVTLDGNVGCIVNGAGLAMATTDIIKLCGGEPANFLDVGGSSNPQKVLSALRIILRNKSLKAILINIFGGITRCDDIANGIVQARKEIDIPVPLVVRLTGTNEKEAKEILAKNNIMTYATMREAVNKVVALAK